MTNQKIKYFQRKYQSQKSFKSVEYNNNASVLSLLDFLNFKTFHFFIFPSSLDF